MFSVLVCLGKQRFSASCHEQGKLCVTGVDIDQILTSNVSSEHLHRNTESTSTGKVSCCRELNQNSFCVSIQLDTSCVHSLLTAGWPKLLCKCKSQTNRAPSPFALRFPLDIPKLSNFVDNAVLDYTAKAIEINLHNIKWLLIGIYRPPSQSKDFFLEEMRKNFEKFCTKYENFLMIGDFNLSEDDDSLDQFMQELNLENVVKVPTCFKSDSPTCIDLILTSDKRKLANI